MITKNFPDVSHYEPGVDFVAMKAAGVQLCITKATQGLNNVDLLLDRYITEMKAAKIIWGDYCYLLPNEGVGDVKWYLQHAGLGSGTLQPIIDAEQNGLTKVTVQAALEFLQAQGYARPILYCSLAYWRDVLGSPTTWDIWLAAYRDEMPYLGKDVKIFAWQHTDSGHCAGVPRACDMNVLVGNLSDYIIP